MPSFICRDVLSAIGAVGARPVYYSVDTALQPVELVTDSSIKAVIAVNYFGFPQDLTPFKDYSNRTGVQIIEDNAHGWLSSDIDGVPLGTRAAVGITSFRKTIRVIDGALLHCADPSLQDRVPKQIDSSSERLSTSFLMRDATARFERCTRLPLIRWLRIVLRSLRKMRSGSALPKSDLLSEVELPLDPRPHQHSLQRFTSLDRELEITRRRDLYAAIEQTLVSAPIKAVFAVLPLGVAPYGFPLICDSAHLSEVEDLLKKFRVEVITWPDLPAAVGANAPDFYQQVRLVNFL
jgi:hypothetical protein